MEAAVLNPQMMPEVDCNSNTLHGVHAELEVKKLQELVRRLERQNEQLRTRANGCAGSQQHILAPSPAYMLGNAGGYRLPGPPPSLLCQSSLGSLCPPPDEPFEFFHPHTTGDGAADGGGEEEEPGVLDELELLDLDTLLPPEETDETWLYVVGGVCVEVPALTPQQWCRQTLDGLRGEAVEAARRSLCHRLDQASRWRNSFSSPSSSPAPPLSRVAGVSPMGASTPAKPCTASQASEKHAPSLSSPLQRTLSPIGKDPSGLAERTPTFFPHQLSRSRSLRRSVLGAQLSFNGEPNGSEAEDDSIVMGYKLQDLTDVQVMARLQEESLRQDYASSSTSSSSTLANRRSHSFSFQLSTLSAGPGLEEEEEEEEDDEDYGLLPPPQPRLTRRLPHSHTFSSARDWRRSTSSLCTPPSTPSTPPYASALGLGFPPPAPGSAGPYAPEQLQQHGFRAGSADYENKLRRSMPNLVRAPSMPSVPIPANPSASPSLLRNSQSFDSSSGLARLQSSIPSPGQLQTRVQSVGNFISLSRQPLKATAYVSPTIKGSVSMPASAGLQSPSSSSSSTSSGIPQPSKQSGGGSSTSPASTPTTPRSSLPRPASFIGTTTGSAPRSKIAQPARSLLTPPKSLSTLSALRDGSWRDGCY